MGKRAKWVNRDEIERRRKEGSYFRYRRKEYRIDKCSLRPIRRPDIYETECTYIKKSEIKLPKIEDLIELDDNDLTITEVDASESKD